jgi:cysteine synthase
MILVLPLFALFRFRGLASSEKTHRLKSTNATFFSVAGKALGVRASSTFCRIYTPPKPALTSLLTENAYCTSPNARTRSLALAVITDAERRGVLKKGDTVVEATSGNTGIAVAMVCAQRGYDCVICMAEPFSVERRKIMRMLGAKVIVTPKAGKGTGMVAKAEELCAEHGWFLCSQFENDANPAFHASTTGPEILQDFAGKQLDYFVTGYGTGGTFQGVGRALKAARPDTKIVLLEPEAAGLIASGVTTERKPTGAPAGSHPAFAAHPIQGWTPDFIPKVLEDAQAMNLYDELVPITGPEAIETAQKLARMEGIFTGISGGASMAGALKVAEKAPKGSVILTMLPDTSERYMSTPLYESIAADMNEEELEIAKSTPSFQLLPDAEPILQA